MSVKTFVSTDSNRPRAVGECDRCGHIYPRYKLAPQMRYAGASIIDTGWRVCSDCVDPLDPQEKLTIPLPDGLPIRDPRSINHVVAARHDWTIETYPAWQHWRSVGQPTVTNNLTPVTPGVGAASWAGSAPTAVYGVNPGSGAVAWTGPAPRVSYTVATGVGAASWTGNAPTAVYSIIPGVGAVVWSGHTPTVARSEYGFTGFAAVGEVAVGQGDRTIT